MAVQSTQQPLQQPSSSSSSPPIKGKQFKFHSVDQFRKVLQEFEPPKEGQQHQITTEAGFTLADPVVEEFFQFVAVTGRPHLPWSLIRPVFMWKLQTVMDEMHVMEAERLKDEHQKEKLIKSEEIKDAKKFIMEKAKEFDGTPFTIQRLCELLVEPTKQYHAVAVFIRALEKNINVVTTITEDGHRITGVNEEFVTEEEEKMPVERNFIVSVDELDEPLADKLAKQQHNGGESVSQVPDSNSDGNDVPAGESEEEKVDVDMKEAD